MSETVATTVDDAEIERFSALAETWWDPEGPMKPLHRLTPARMRYLTHRLTRHFDRPEGGEALTDLDILDIGCGGGLVSEPLSRLAASVTGVDASEKNIKAARMHAAEAGLPVTYRHDTAEALAAAGEQFDAVMALEIIEHVADPALFVSSIAQLVKPGGLVIFSTINRTPKAYALSIVGAEYILGWLPRGTHTYSKFVKPSELARHCRAAGLKVDDLTGLVYSPLSGFSLSATDIDVNYFASATKPG
ncbi:bifunctional 2-polyprenyl-6-hydroxyphenol methylase/3-demethylubiquinol 3-O-methyltransferase UbiG [Minwuia sp.]|uniref:bifunctional 2-polyprenyl-6-hydroxyphenol methylase/3-demethylubiquinol 3-O-methyltransferase UbiG n=1 Tax=Minwuia sp. TaxID=2493630 RepID=UPI003A94D2AD